MNVSNYHFRPLQLTDCDTILQIMNYFVDNGFAAYSEEHQSDQTFYDNLMPPENYPGYVIEIKGSDIIGFGRLKPYRPSKSFEHTAEIGYFILPDHINRGLGSILLEKLIHDAKRMNITILLAHLSSKNETSLKFHQKMGFEECGRFRKIGKKWDQNFDLVWMQKYI